ncbi:MAG: DUF1810 domain-containing protein [Pseudomonadota bacterium]
MRRRCRANEQRREVAISDLNRFRAAQERDHAQALAELRAGRKLTHWIWYVLPQLRDLGRSERALFYGISDAEEAAAYLADPVLGPRLKECVTAVLQHSDKTAHEIFGSPDDLKFRSCMTLFHLVEPSEPLFRQALDAFYGGDLDAQTERLLRTTRPGAAPQSPK